MRTAGDAFVCAIVCAACARNGALSRLGYTVLSETMIFSCAVRFCTRRLEGMLCVHVQCHDEGILFTVG